MTGEKDKSYQELTWLNRCSRYNLEREEVGQGQLYNLQGPVQNENVDTLFKKVEKIAKVLLKQIPKQSFLLSAISFSSWCFIWFFMLF